MNYRKYKLSDFIDRNSRPFLDEAAKNPGLYNPLFLSGFCGKTHAACGVLNAIAENAPLKKVHWVSAERFVMEWIYCRERGCSEDFYEFYLGFDALYVEAVNRLSEKQEATDAAVKIFEHLINEQKQVIFCCWQGIEGVPISLLPVVRSGATLHLEHPCEDDLPLIVGLKTRESEVYVPPYVTEHLIRVSRNIWELEGRIQLFAKSDLHLYEQE